MKQDWQTLTKMAQDKEVIISRVEIPETGVAIEGRFELPPLARLSMEDQVFVAAFVRTHGSIKEMERLYGVSYPTIKNRLKKIFEKLEFMGLEVNVESCSKSVLDLLNEGKLSFEEAMKELKR